LIEWTNIRQYTCYKWLFIKRENTVLEIAEIIDSIVLLSILSFFHIWRKQTIQSQKYQIKFYFNNICRRWFCWHRCCNRTSFCWHQCCNRTHCNKDYSVWMISIVALRSVISGGQNQSSSITLVKLELMVIWWRNG